MTAALVAMSPAVACQAAALGERVLGPGHWGADVFELQLRLRDLGYQLAADGRFGPETKKAVMAFQKAHNLPVDGLVGRNTALLLVARYGVVEYQVRPGDTISAISAQYGVEEAVIRRFNTVNDTKLQVGQILRFPALPRYQVREGDTLESIARNHQTSVSELQRLNNMGDSTALRAGSWLILPTQSYP